MKQKWLRDEEDVLAQFCLKKTWSWFHKVTFLNGCHWHNLNVSALPSVKHIQENPVVSPALLITIEMSSHWHLCAPVCVCRGRHRFTNKFTVFRHYKDIFFMVTNIRAVVCITTNRHWLTEHTSFSNDLWIFCHITDNASACVWNIRQWHSEWI